MLSGFVPLMSAPLKLAFVHSTVDKVTLSLDIEIRCWLNSIRNCSEEVIFSNV